MDSDECCTDAFKVVLMVAEGRDDTYSASAGGTVFDGDIEPMLSCTVVMVEYCCWLAATDTVRDKR